MAKAPINQEPPQVTRLRKTYAALELLKPKEGRDYRVLIRSEGNLTMVNVEGVTPLGIAFAEQCQRNLEAAVVIISEGDNSGGTIRRTVDPVGPDGGTEGATSDTPNPGEPEKGDPGPGGEEYIL